MPEVVRLQLQQPHQVLAKTRSHGISKRHRRPTRKMGTKPLLAAGGAFGSSLHNLKTSNSRNPQISGLPTVKDLPALKVLQRIRMEILTDLGVPHILNPSHFPVSSNCPKLTNKSLAADAFGTWNSGKQFDLLISACLSSSRFV